MKGSFVLYEITDTSRAYIDSYSESLEEKAYEDAEQQSRFIQGKVEVRFRSGNPLDREILMRLYNDGEALPVD
jgi:hypothetical protein